MPAHGASEDARKRAYVAGIHVFCASMKTWMAGASPAMTTWVSAPRSEDPPHAATADLPIAALTLGITSSAINCIDRLLSAGSTQSMPA